MMLSTASKRLSIKSTRITRRTSLVVPVASISDSSLTRVLLPSTIDSNNSRCSNYYSTSSSTTPVLSNDLRSQKQQTLDFPKVPSPRGLHRSILPCETLFYRPTSYDHSMASFSTTTDNNNENQAAESATTSTSTTTTGEEVTMEFQAETRQLLDIVIHSLYTDKDVFVRELVSNASDALEKLRHLQATNSSSGGIIQSDVPLEIRIDLDEVTSTITIADTGVGMTRDEMVRNLGTIARSGSKNFVKGLASAEQQVGSETASSIIGQFGVGFYSAFMVANKVEVRSLSAVGGDNPNTTANVWRSDGVMGSFSISTLAEDIRQDRGTSVVLYMDEKYWDYVSESKMEQILKRYSNFINFPIYLNGKRINTQRAIWTQDPKEVTEDEYIEFYKYYANAIDDPMDTYHFRADAPIDMKVLFFVPSFHSEKYGMGRMEPGVSLYSRKVLIEHKSPDILPDWMRFIKGVVDSEDLPLAISREKAQDSALIAKLRRTLVRKFVAHLTTMKKKDPTKFLDDFYKEYSFFIKEGICQDYEFQGQLSKLLHFQTSRSGDMISFDEYISNMRPEQKDIYYLVAPSRSAALNSPYLEVFQKANVEVLFLFTAIEDFVMANLEQYEGRKLISVEKGDIDLSALTNDIDKDEKDKEKNDKEEDKDNIYKADRELTSAEIVDFCDWFRTTALGTEKVASCTVTNRLSSSPAIVTDNESGALRRMMRLIDTSSTDGSNRENGVPLPKQHVEINVKHPIIVGIYDIIKTEPTLARILAEQVFDNCLVAAGLLDDSRSMLPRLNDILVCVVKGAKEQKQNDGSSSDSDSDNEESNQNKKE